MSETIRNHYFDTRSIDETTLYEYARVYSDTTFNFGINQAAQLHGSTSSGKTFFYRFSVDGRLNGMKLPTLAYQQSLPGATHADDLYYVFGYSGCWSRNKHDFKLCSLLGHPAKMEMHFTIPWRSIQWNAE